jgi:hypothetical protein
MCSRCLSGECERKQYYALLNKGEKNMPVADYKTYCRMIDHAFEKKFAYPAINVTSLTTANGVLKGLAESKSDGIIQVSTGGGGLCLRVIP